MRNSSIELFRIIATLLVLIVHFNGWFVDMPSTFTGFSVFTISQDIIESISCICVNCFLVITGWYGLRFKWKHVWNIWSVLVWIYVPFYLVYSYFYNDFSIKLLLFKIIAIGQESYYVQCYLMLLFLSPILNSFIEKFGKRILPYTLAFWVIEIVFDWILQNMCLGFGRGYELTHFILMYLLGQTAFLYRKEIRKYYKSKYCVMSIISGTVVISIMYLVLPSKYCFVYSNPLNIIMAFSLFFIFERKTMHSRFINWIASSTLAVYILHITPPFINILREWDFSLLQTHTYPVYLGLISITIFIVFASGILYDKIRILLLLPIVTKTSNWLSKNTIRYSLSNQEK